MRLKAPSQPGCIGNAPNGKGMFHIRGIRSAMISANEAKIAVIHQRDGSSSARPRQNSKPDSASNGAAMHDDSAMRYGNASRKAGMVQAAVHNNGVNTTAVQI